MKRKTRNKEMGTSLETACVSPDIDSLPNSIQDWWVTNIICLIVSKSIIIHIYVPSGVNILHKLMSS